jgi:hypothetical protein
MLVRIGLPAMAVMAAAWTLVQPDTPRPADTGAAVQQAAAEIEEAPSSAIELLGETWTVDAPAPIVRPLSAAEHAEVIAAMRRSDDGVAAAPAASERDRSAAPPRAASHPASRACRTPRCRSTTARPWRPRGLPMPVHRRLRTGRRAPFGPAAGHRPSRTGRLRRAALGRPPAGQWPRDRGGPACRGAGHPDLALRAFAEGVRFSLGNSRILRLSSAQVPRSGFPQFRHVAPACTPKKAAHGAS